MVVDRAHISHHELVTTMRTLRKLGEVDLDDLTRPQERGAANELRANALRLAIVLQCTENQSPPTEVENQSTPPEVKELLAPWQQDVESLALALYGRPDRDLSTWNAADPSIRDRYRREARELLVRALG